MHPIFEFKGLITDGIYSMAKVEWWLLKYTDEYEKTVEIENKLHWYEFEDGSKSRLPSFWKPSSEVGFINLFQELDLISEFYKEENKIEDVLKEYYAVKNSGPKLNKWILEYEQLGKGKYFNFLISYLDYEGVDDIEHPMVFIHSMDDFPIYIEKNDFKNTIEFGNIFL
ncbi:hypothetical protein [Aurantibacter sp.]|uniref:hypothetical protein n=1 Tax=Aurantibacter sp. TaxID=2807103 RepID=UPI00326343B5